MGFWDFDGGSVVSRKPSHGGGYKYTVERKKHRSKSRSRSRSHSRGAHSTVASLFGGDHYRKHNSSRGSFFGLPNASRSCFFGLSTSPSPPVLSNNFRPIPKVPNENTLKGKKAHAQFNRSSTNQLPLPGRPSYYKRSPRHGFIHRAYKKLKHLLRELVHYAKKHPLKVFMLALVPLLSGGVLTALLARFGLRLPPTIERMLGMATKAATGDSIGLVGEAVRMAGDFGASNVSIERGRDGGMQWERKKVQGEGGWGDGIMGVAKMFI
jgi:hypothetical protein